MNITPGYNRADTAKGEAMKINLPIGYKGEILIIDDDPTSLELLYGMLTAEQYDVRVVNSGTLALTAVKASLPDLILLDINMPDMDGYEVCRRLKADPNTQAVPIIFISANDQTIDKVQAFTIGGIDYITKPFQIAEIIVRIESQLKIAHLSRELQMQLLRYQLNPHFLFNALNSIRALVLTNGEAADKMIAQLGEYLRFLLTGRNKLEVPVQEELNAALNYLAIEQIRFEDRLRIETSIDSQASGYLMPAFLIQPLLENAIKYGMKTSPRPLQINLSVKVKEELLYIGVANSGYWITEGRVDIPESASLGIGLRNIRQRLRQRYPGCHSFTITDSNGQVNVGIEFPVC